MRALGARVATQLRAGDLVVLAGGLGAGKTTFVQGVGAELGVDGAVVSPTFVIARVHRGGRGALVHVDAYRLGAGGGGGGLGPGPAVGCRSCMSTLTGWGRSWRSTTSTSTRRSRSR